MTIDPYANCNYTIPPDVACTLDTCCLAQSNFLYIPNFGGNLFFTIFFAVFILPQLWLGIRYRTWGFMIGMIVGLILEVVGYAGRLILHDNPFDGNGFLIYLICLTIAPVFISAAIYLSIARIINLYGEHLSFFKPRTIALAFMTSDLLSLIFQAAGGGIADTSEGDAKQTGINIMIAGLFLQAVSLGVFLLYLAIFASRCRSGPLDMDSAKVTCRSRSVFKIFLLSLLLATVTILIRSIFRVVELWEGFSGALWNDEVDFMILDGGMIGYAVLVLTLFHPGPAFKEEWHTAKWTIRTQSRRARSGSQVRSHKHKHQPGKERPRS